MRVVLIDLAQSPKQSEILAALAAQGFETLVLQEDKTPAELRDQSAYLLISQLDAASSTLLPWLRTEAAQGKPLLGLGQGAATLIETGLLPGFFLEKPTLKLAANLAGNEPKKVIFRLSDDYQYNAYTRCLSPKIRLDGLLNCPQTRLLLPEGLLREVLAQGLNVFSYCNSEGQINEDLDTNPAGSTANLAALSNKAGNIMGLFPEPNALTLDALLLSLKEHLLSGFIEKVEPLYYWPRGV